LRKTIAAPPLIDLPPRDVRIAHYHARAHDCIMAAEAATDPCIRLQLIELANKYAVLVLRLHEGRSDVFED
jgi:hypothetical protein